ncbi:kin of IRRE-like protein 1 [Anneissia japonica]|uniref:kin of IRRE-like protein 1 n=1 Tax=Anneissia japonica TaxID=1529436 RepID=UPI001425B041|nr:kin of IRRE-like protein 1 [Anneissia japonica]
MAVREILIFMLSLAYFIHTSAGGSFVVDPSDAASARGATTRFLCTVSIGDDEEVYWHFEPSGSNSGDVATIGPFTNRNPTAFPQYRITGDSSNGIYNLEISDTKITDKGKYSCLIVKGSMTMMKEAELTMVRDNTDRPSGPATCNNGNLTKDNNEGDVVNISCTITGGVPLAILQIVRIRETSSHEVVSSSTSIAGDAVTETAIFTMSSVDHNARFQCIVLHPDKTEIGSFSCDFSPINIQVTFAPVVSIYPSELLIDGNDDNKVITLTCDVNANPQEDSVTWDYQTKISTAEVNGAELKFTGVRESYIGETITCNARNSIGSRNDSITIKESDNLLPFDTYILFIIIAGGCLLFFLFVCLIIVCCCQKDDDASDDKNLRYQVNDSRPTSMRQQEMTNNDEIIDGFDSDNFSGGSEANLVRDESKKSRASARSTGTDRADNRSSVRSNDYINDVNTFENSAYSPDEDELNDTPLY